MNKRVTPSLELRIERLVDGELSREDYRALLLELDREPGAWRHCALAFLEAQALGGELRVIRATAAQASLTVAQHDVPERRSGSWKPAVRWLAMAASWLLVFGLGVYATRPTTTPSVTPRADFASNENRPIAGPDLRRGVPTPAGMARFEFAGADGRNRQLVDMPIGAPEDLNQLMATQTPALSPELRRVIRGAGHDVQPRERQFVPVVGPNGESLILPVDDYRFVRVRPTF